MQNIKLKIILVNWSIIAFKAHKSEQKLWSSMFHGRLYLINLNQTHSLSALGEITL